MMHRRSISLFDVSHLLHVWLVTLELNINHGIGVYEVNEFRFADPFVGYGFAFLEYDGILVTVSDAEEKGVVKPCPNILWTYEK